MSAVLRLSELSKTFGSNRVLDELSMELAAGEIHALLGHNGSGKSTFIKILSGFYTPDDSPPIEINGVKQSWPLQSQGNVPIAFVHQDLGLLNGISIADNFVLGSYPMRAGAIDWKKTRLLVREALAEFDIDIDPARTLDHTVSPGQRALIALARAVSSIRAEHSNGVLILDEPTVYLTDKETELLQQKVRQLASTGIAVIYVTHRLRELDDFADAATVLREGKTVYSGPLSELEPDALVTFIAGTNAAIVNERAARKFVADDSAPAVVIERLSTERLNQVSLSAQRGEIVGLAGLVGMGQEDVIEATFGSLARSSGTIELGGKPIGISPGRSIASGVGMLPADRVHRSGSIDHTVAENISLPVLKSHMQGVAILKRSEISTAQKLNDQFDVLPRNATLLLGNLSGGNQQKALLAKWLQSEPELLLLIEPAQGVDIGAKRKIFELIVQAAEQGTTVLVASTEHEDLATLCDRVLVFRDGSIADELKSPGITGEMLLRAFHE